MTNRRDSFFLWTALAIAATVFAGFWFTYFGPMYEGNRAPSVVVVHLHGWTFFAWYVLLVVQAALAHSRQLSLHRMLGGLSVVLAVLMVGTGLLVVGVRMADALDTGDPFWSASGPAVFATLVLFVGFYAAGLRMRRANVGEASRNAAAALPCPAVQWRLSVRTRCGRSPTTSYSARRGPRPAGRPVAVQKSFPRFLSRGPVAAPSIRFGA